MSLSPAVSCRWLLLSGIVLAAALPAQQTKLERDVQFVRQLATRLRFISLAQSEIERLQQVHKNAADFQSIAQLGIEISLVGAKLQPNRQEKRTLYQDALKRCREFLERYNTGPAALAARMTLADAALEFGRFLSDEVEIAQSENPDAVKDLEEQAAQTFREGEDACDQAMKALNETKDTDAQAKTDYHLTWMRKGVLLREHGRAVKKDRTHLAEFARTTLEDLVLSVGEETALGQRALFEAAQVDEVLGNLDLAVQAYRDVIDSADKAVSDPELDLPTEVKELMVVTMEEAYDHAAETLFESGKTEAVIKITAEYREHLAKLNVPLTSIDEPGKEKGNEDEKFGHSLYVSYARALAETGKSEDVSKALKLVQYLNEQHPNDVVGLRAKLALKEILAAQAQHVSGTLLLEVAKGDYQSKEWEPAIRGFKRAIAAMTPEELSRSGLEAYYLMANSFALQGRVLEATLALQRGIEGYADSAPDAIKENAVSLVQRTMRQVRANTSGDAFFEPLFGQVTDIAARHGSVSDAAKRYWQEASRLLQDKRYDDSLAMLAKIPSDSMYFEWAKARAAATLDRKGDTAGARKVIADYRAFLQTPEARIPDDRKELNDVRRFTQGEMGFTEANLVYEEATGGEAGGKGDLTKFPEVVKLLSDFEARHGKGVPHLLPNVHFMLGRSYLETGNFDKAQEKYATLRAMADPGAKRFVGILAASIFTTQDGLATAKQKEVEALGKKPDDPALRSAEEQLNNLRRSAVAIGLEYVESSEAPQYGIAFLSLQHLQELKDHERVESFGNKMLEVFGKDPANTEKIDRFVRPIIGDAILRQRKFRQAFDMLTAAEKASPQNMPLKRLVCLALGGWQEVDARGQVQRFEGLGKPAEAYDKYWGEYRSYALNTTRGVERYSLPWYEFHWEAYHFALQAAKTDSKFAERARTIYSLARSTDDFAHLDSLGKPGKTLRDLFLDRNNQPPR